MRKNKPDVILNRQPYVSRMRFLDISLGTMEEVLDEIFEDVNNRFTPGEGRDVAVLDVCR